MFVVLCETYTHPFPAVFSNVAVVLLIWIWYGLPLLSIRAAVLTVCI
jgi:hypothetical protein